MSFFSLISVFILEQWRPFPGRLAIHAVVDRVAAFLEEHFNAGQVHHGVIAWCIAVLPVVLLTWGANALLHRIHPLLGFLFNVAVLYMTMGFRQGSHYFTSIHRALKDGDVELARTILAEWRGQPGAALTAEEIVRLTIEQALLGAHRYVFAVIFWFALLPGPTGAILYRLCELLAERWARPQPAASEKFGLPSRLIFHALDALPARLTGVGFAIVGDFEDAIFCWRGQASTWPDRVAGIVLASGAGAMGVRLGMPVHTEEGGFDDRPELGTGDEAEVDYLDSTVGLLWRALILWLAMILIVTIVQALS
jgi:adenosylcobinamide-phosphate synthase